MPSTNEPTNQTHARRLTSESEIQRVFDSLNLSTNEERAKYIISGWTLEVKEPPKHTYTTRLSNNSEPINPRR